jgi:hypothetical protein
MALRLGWTPTMVSRIETGRRAVTSMKMIKYISACGVHDRQQDALIQLADEPDGYRLKQHSGKLPDELRELICHESTATTIENFEPIHVPGITQTEDYAHAVFGAARERPARSGWWTAGHARTNVASAVRRQQTAMLHPGGSGRRGGAWVGARIVPHLRVSRRRTGRPR